ncbi:hypothetical protein OAQ30_02760 [Nitrosopumilus sp.]|jgi:hypothetical protein|nr:hypothetical protein [Nitrosopumilus sp.]|tara:strand:+ start:1483 stop:1875 length:393 start_codon:yes stop_codon:yes gene_type:complete
MSQIIEYDLFVNRLFNLDKNIRFVAVANKSGEILAKGSKPNTPLLLSPEETQETLHHAISAWKSREKHYSKIGEGLYTLAVYEKLRRATIPLPSGNLLLVTIDNAGGQQQIMDKIINEVKIHDHSGTTSG